VTLDDALPPVTRSGSLAMQVYDAIRASIADGRLAAGARVTERELARVLAVSPTPVREAISKLEHEGLLERVGVRRLQVADHPAETLHELMEVEVMLRGAEARFAARKISPETIERMRAYLAEIVATRDLLTLAELFDMAQRFDAELARAASNPALRTLIESYAIYGNDFRLARAAQDVKDPGFIDRRIAEHGAIIEALAAHDENEAERLMRAHARSSIKDL
jgi:DNA-binding GntR family transcriptional regulator